MKNQTKKWEKVRLLTENSVYLRNLKFSLKNKKRPGKQWRPVKGYIMLATSNFEHNLQYATFHS
jgi:hypothetical protein